ncbi:MAG: hypothetical protein ACOCW3_02790 [Spirochaetota bacterium]
MRRRRAPETSDRGDPGFHYDREERLGERGQREPEQGGIFGRNRSLAITLLDLLLVLIIFTVYMVFFRPGASDALGQLDGYAIDATAFVFEADVYVTVTVGLADEVSAPEGGDSLVSLGFPDGTVTTDVLPSDEGFPTTVRHVFPADELGRGDPEIVAVVIEARGRERTLEIPIADD